MTATLPIKRYKTGKIREKNYSIILDAAEALFAINGFKGTSMMRIAEQAELPKANIHYYFKSKHFLPLPPSDIFDYLEN